MAALVRKNSKCPEVKWGARLRLMLPYWPQGLQSFWKTLRSLLVCIPRSSAHSPLPPKSARYVNLVLPFLSTPNFETVHINRQTLLHRNFFLHFHHLTSPTHRHRLLRFIAFQLTSLLSIDISHDLSVIITPPNYISTCADIGPQFHAVTLEFLLLSGPRLLGDPLGLTF